jgi:hypothetical protein
MQVRLARRPVLVGISSWSVADDRIRALLASMPPASLVSKPPGTVAIAETMITPHVEEAGLDLEAVRAWITAHDGRIVRPPPVQSQGLRAGRRVARTVPADPYYLIPIQALAE